MNEKIKTILQLIRDVVVILGLPSLIYYLSILHDQQISVKDSEISFLKTQIESLRGSQVERAIEKINATKQFYELEIKNRDQELEKIQHSKDSILKKAALLMTLSNDVNQYLDSFIVRGGHKTRVSEVEKRILELELRVRLRDKLIENQQASIKLYQKLAATDERYIANYAKLIETIRAGSNSDPYFLWIGLGCLVLATSIYLAFSFFKK